MKAAMKVAMKISHRPISLIKRSRHWRDNCISSYKCSEGGLKDKLGNFIEMLGAVRKPHLPDLGNIKLPKYLLNFIRGAVA